MVLGRWFGRTWLEAQAGGRSRLGTGVLALRTVCVLVVLLGAILAFGAAGASAEPFCTDTWTGPSEGEWTKAEDWNTGKVPTSTSVACIGSGKTVNVTEGTNQTGVVQGEGKLVISRGSLEVGNTLEASVITSLSISGGTLTGSGEVDVAGSFSGSEGSVTGSGVLVIESGVTGSIASGGDINLDRTLVNKGTFTIPNEGGLGGEEAGKFENSGTLTVNGEAGLHRGMFRNGFSGPAPILVNTGTLQRTEGTGQLQVEFAINNEGTVNVSTGQLLFTSGGTSGAEHAGSWSAASGSEIKLEGTSSYALGSSVPVSGAIVIGRSSTATAGTIEGSKGSVSNEGGLLEVNGSTPSTVASLSFASGGGTLTGSGEIDVTGSFTGTGGGLIKGSGVLVIESGASGTISSGERTILDRTLVNKGAFTIPNESGLGGEEAGKFENSGTLTVNGLENLSTGMYRVKFSEVPMLVNTGTLQRTEGTGNIQIEFAFENYGIIDEVTGKFRFTDPVMVRESASQYGGAENPSTPGQTHSECGDPVSCATGNYTETQTDFAIGGRGVGLDLTRTYNSQAGRRRRQRRVWLRVDELVQRSSGGQQNEQSDHALSG